MNKKLSTIINTIRPLLSIFSILKNHHFTINNEIEFYELLVTKIDMIVETLTQAQISTIDIDNIKYFISAALDEAYCSLSKNSNLVKHYYDESLSGENFFNRLELIKKTDNKNHIIFVGILIINLGFKGKYGVKENGVEKLNIFKNNLLENAPYSQQPTNLYINDQDNSKIIDIKKYLHQIIIFMSGLYILLCIHLHIEYQLLNNLIIQNLAS